MFCFVLFFCSWTKTTSEKDFHDCLLWTTVRCCLDDLVPFFCLTLVQLFINLFSLFLSNCGSERLNPVTSLDRSGEHCLDRCEQTRCELFQLLFNSIHNPPKWKRWKPCQHILKRLFCFYSTKRRRRRDAGPGKWHLERPFSFLTV